MPKSSVYNRGMEEEERNYGPKKSYDTISNINVLFNQITLNLVHLLKIHSIFV